MDKLTSLLLRFFSWRWEQVVWTPLASASASGPQSLEANAPTSSRPLSSRRGLRPYPQCRRWLKHKQRQLPRRGLNISRASDWPLPRLAWRQEAWWISRKVLRLVLGQWNPLKRDHPDERPALFKTTIFCLFFFLLFLKPYTSHFCVNESFTKDPRFSDFSVMNPSPEAVSLLRLLFFFTFINFHTYMHTNYIPHIHIMYTYKVNKWNKQNASQAKTTMITKGGGGGGLGDRKKRKWEQKIELHNGHGN